MWMLYNQHLKLTYLLASCYVDGSVHSAGRSGDTQDQNNKFHASDLPVNIQTTNTENWTLLGYKNIVKISLAQIKF